MQIQALFSSCVSGSRADEIDPINRRRTAEVTCGRFERGVNLARAESLERPDCCSSAEPARPERTWGSRRTLAAHSIPERIRSTRRMLAESSHTAHGPAM